MDFVGGLVRHGNRIYFLVENIAGTGSFVQGAEIVEMGLDGADAKCGSGPKKASTYAVLPHRQSRTVLRVQAVNTCEASRVNGCGECLAKT